MAKTLFFIVLLFGLFYGEAMGNTVYLPIIEKHDPNYFAKGGVEHCEPNAGITYVNGFASAGRPGFAADVEIFGGDF